MRRDFPAQSREVQISGSQLLAEVRNLVLKEVSAVLGFNVGINSGVVADRTVMHCHVHLIPRRLGDNPNPRGEVYEA